MKKCIILFLSFLFILFCCSAQTAHDYTEQAKNAYNNDDYIKSIDLCNKAIQTDPLAHAAYRWRAHARLELSLFQDALSDYNMAISIEPNDTNYYNRGVYYFRVFENNNDSLDLLYKTIDDLTSAIEFNPDYSGAYPYRGLAKYILQDYKGAIFDFDKAMQLNPEDPIANYYRGFATTQLRINSAPNFDSDALYKEIEQSNKTIDIINNSEKFIRLYPLKCLFSNDVIDNSKIDFIIAKYKQEILKIENKNKNEEYSELISTFYGLSNYVSYVYQHQKPNIDELNKSISLMKGKTEWFLFFPNFVLGHTNYKNQDFVKAEYYYTQAYKYISLIQDSVYYNNELGYYYNTSLLALIQTTSDIKKYNKNLMYCDSLINFYQKSYLDTCYGLFPLYFKTEALYNLNRIPESYFLFVNQFLPKATCSICLQEYPFMKDTAYFANAYFLYAYILIDMINRFEPSPFIDEAYGLSEKMIYQYKSNNNNKETADWFWVESIFLLLDNDTVNAFNSLDSAIHYDNFSGCALCLYGDMFRLYGTKEYIEKGISALKNKLKNFEDDYVNLGIIYRNISDLFLINNELDSALFYNNKYPVINSNHSIPFIEQNSKIYLAMKDYEESLKNLYQCMCILKDTICNINDYLSFSNLFDNFSIFQFYSVDMFLRLVDFADVLKSAYIETSNGMYLQNYYYSSLVIFKYFDKLAKFYRLDMEENNWIELSSEMYTQASYILNNYQLLEYFASPKDIYNIIEKSKSVYLRTLMDTKHFLDKLPEDFYENLAQERVLLNTTDNSDVFTNSIERIYEHYDMINAMFPEVYQAIFSTDIVSLESLQNNLDDNQALIEFFIGDSIVTSLYIENKNFVVHQFNFIENSFDLLLAEYKESLKANDRSEYYTFQSIAHNLYNELLKPFEEYIKDSTSLIIIPDGLLYNIPFEALVTEPIYSENQTIDKKRINYVIKRNPISYHYSATLWFNTKNRAAKKTERPEYVYFTAAPFSGENYSNDISYIPNETDEQQYTYASCSNTNKIMEWTGSYSDAIISLSPSKSKSLTYKEATLLRVKSEIGSYRYVNLLTHGCVEDKETAFLLFYDEEAASPDAKLTIKDVFNLNLNADIVVLAACQSGVGDIVKGEGMMSLARGFLYSGADNIIYGLFPINHKHMSELVYEFFKNNENTNNFSKALQKSKIHLIEKGVNVQDWSSLILLGVD